MGNENCALKGLEVDDKAVEITDFWIHHSANIQGSNPQSLSVFISEPSLHSAASFGNPSPLERAAKNLMLHRHPCILRYVSSWGKGSKFFLATEQVKPLVQVINSQTTLQICIGLHNILRALIFLHEKASASHNNVCSSSIFVTSEGCWKLGGLEYLCQFSDLNSTYIRKIKSFRYEKAISPNESSIIMTISEDPSVIDRFAFAVLVEEVLKNKSADDIPELADFRELSKGRFTEVTLSSLTSHPFFINDFMRIHAFLTELPIQSEDDKEDFFSNLVPQLQTFPKKIIAEQLGRLLLSRMVLLDPTAQMKLLPYVLKPQEDENDTGLFSMSTFRTYLVPKLLQMFCVRDTPIRMILLSHLNLFIKTFNSEELKYHVLPELLVGIKDTNDVVVSTTLRALADLVLILGGTTVIGGNRGKLFTDGRPDLTQRRKNNVVINGLYENVNNLTVPISSSVNTLHLPERLSPDGGEDKSDTVFTSVEEEAWTEWDNECRVSEATDSIQHVKDTKNLSTEVLQKSSTTSNTDNKRNYVKRTIITDITELDIKNSKSMQETRDEFDFFVDMEPVIHKTQVLHIEQASVAEQSKNVFDVAPAQDAAEDEFNGWGDDWNAESID